MFTSTGSDHVNSCNSLKQFSGLCTVEVYIEELYRATALLDALSVFLRSYLEDYLPLQEAIRGIDSPREQKRAQEISLFCVTLLLVAQKINDA